MVQGLGGFVVGLGLGLTPGGAVADQVLTTARVMPRGTRQAEVGKAVGAMLGGFILTASGVSGEIIGTGLTSTGIGSLIGVPAMVVSAGLVTSGAGNMAAGLKGFADALMSKGSGGGEQAAGGGLGKAISEGHAFEKHVVTKGEFKDLGIKTPENFAKHIDNVITNARGTNVRELSGGRTAYWDDVTGTVVIRNPSAPDMGTAFRPTLGKTYFTDILK
jgi:hypothetical protein